MNDIVVRLNMDLEPDSRRPDRSVAKRLLRAEEHPWHASEKAIESYSPPCSICSLQVLQLGPEGPADRGRRQSDDPAPSPRDGAGAGEVPILQRLLTALLISDS